MSEIKGDPVSSAQDDSKSAGELLPLLYEELRRLAAVKLAREAPGQTLQATALVHEAWLRLAGQRRPGFNDRQHFLAAAAEAMRRILIDNARRKRALRRGGGQQRLEFHEFEIAIADKHEELLAVNEALERLEAHDSTKAQLVKLRFFGGLTLGEAAEVLHISVPTAKRHWCYARAWLYREIRRMHEA